jgi:hypothetical protein
MTDTPHLTLPVIDALAQKHLIANDAFAMLDALVMLAVLDRDLSAPPGSPAEGDRYLVKATGAGLFAGHDNEIAHFTAGDWSFYPPRAGWICFVADEAVLLAWNGASWTGIASLIELQNLAELGVGTTADPTNPFSAKLSNALWVAKTVAEGGDGSLRTKLSKESAANTLSLLFQDNFSGRAEIGLAGDDDFHFKVSPDGSTWTEAIKIEAATGRVSFPAQGAREVLTAARTYYVRTDGSDGNDGLSNTSAGAFLTIQKAIDTVADTLDLSAFDVAIQVGDGTYTGNVVVYGPWIGRGNVTLHGNVTTPANCVLAPSSGVAIRVGRSLGTLPTNTNAKLVVGGFKITTNNSIGISAEEGSAILIDAAMEYGAHGTGTHIQASRRAEVFVNASYTISGNANRHWSALSSSVLICTNKTITLNGSPAFGFAFLAVSRVSVAIVNANTFGGSTGTSSKRYDTASGGVIDTTGAGIGYLPGDTAGTDDGTGIYV